MPQVPQFDKPPIKSIYNPREKNRNAPASMKQKNFIITLCERRKIPVPNLKTMTMGEAAQLLSEMNDTKH